MSHRARSPSTALRPTRRALLAGLGAGAASAFGLARLARADAPPPSGTAVLLCFFPGGWDQLLLLDPRDPSRFTASEAARTRIDPRYDELVGLGYRPELVRPRAAPAMVLGPLAERPGAAVQLTDFAGRMAVVRGVDMRSVSHEVATRYFLTTEFPRGSLAQGSSVSTTLTALARPARPVAHLSLGVESYNDRHPSRWSALRVTSADDLLATLCPAGAVDPVLADALDAYAREARADVYNRRGLVDRLQGARAVARGLDRDDVSRPFRALVDDGPENDALRARFGISRGDFDGPRARAAMAALALTSGLSQVVIASVAPAMDTHFVGNAGHARLLGEGLDAFVALLDALRTTAHPEGGSHLDHTTVLAFSEFARTPLYNTYGGRDHHSAGSCLLLGRGVRGGVVAGATSDVGMVAVPWDLTRGGASPSGTVLTPAHVAATVAAAAGLDPTAFDAPPISQVLV
ncbi:MAG: DUF1501 domain-containing protein [Deltaproteobacteria bacterium]|nr:DUF1501 domain-containing protein [Deltaproteobacteria bacterium]